MNYKNYDDQTLKMEQLLKNIKEALPEMKKLLEEINSSWVLPDLFYRYYHNSFKVYYIQDYTLKIVDFLKKLAPEGCENLNNNFIEILNAGINKKFHIKHNDKWDKHTLPMLQAFFHAKTFLEMGINSAENMKSAESTLPPSWAAFVYLYGLR